MSAYQRAAASTRPATVTGIFALASVAAMQGRIAMYHFLGDAVAPLEPEDGLLERLHRPGDRHGRLHQADVDAGKIDAGVVKLPLLRNPRAKMQGIRDGFVKIFCRPGTGIVVGGVVVAPRASELIHPISIAVDNNLTVEQIANAFTVYPSLSGSIAEVARQLHTREGGQRGLTARAVPGGRTRNRLQESTGGQLGTYAPYTTC